MCLTKYHAFFPIYNEQGKYVTCLIDSDGTLDSKPISIQNFTRQFLARYHLDLPTLQCWSNKLLKYKIHIPLVINQEYSYILVKVRETYSETETPFGYFLASAISDYDDFTITLTSGKTIEVLSTKAYICMKLRDAQFLSYDYHLHKQPHDFMRPPICYE